MSANLQNCTITNIVKYGFSKPNAFGGNQILDLTQSSFKLSLPVTSANTGMLYEATLAGTGTATIDLQRDHGRFDAQGTRPDEPECDGADHRVHPDPGPAITLPEPNTLESRMSN